jgi:hypothetical protein
MKPKPLTHSFNKQIETGLRLMRYGGEFKFFGGSKDEEDMSLKDTAERELREELLIQSSTPIESIRLFNTKITKVIKGRSYNMHNFVAFESENRFLQELEDVSSVNKLLRQRENEFQALLRSGAWWTMSKEKRIHISPETHQVKWWKLRDIIKILFESKSQVLRPVNQFQLDEFNKYNIKNRDAMFQTMATLIEIDQFDSEKALLDSVLSKL